MRLSAHRSLILNAALAAALAFFATLAAPAAAQQPGSLLFGAKPGEAAAGASPSHTTIELIADTTAVVPGKSFRLGVLFRMEPDWHIYWRSPGDVGLPTVVNWRLPEGYEAGELQWPNPVRKDDPSAGVSYAYDGEVLLFAEVTPPAEIKEPSATFGADAEWLACKVECIPGDGSAELKLPVGGAAAGSNAETFDKFAARIPKDAALAADVVVIDAGPRSFEAAPGAAVARKVRIEAKPPWTLAPDAGATELFPDKFDAADLVHPKFARMGEASGEFAWELKVWEEAPAREHPLRDALTVGLLNAAAGERRSLLLALPEARLVIRGGAPAPTAAPEASPAVAAASPREGGPIFSFLNPEQAASTEKRSLAGFLLFAFLGGLILNVMPCVLPVLSIKVLSFVREAGEDPKRIFRMGLVFAAGVFFSFGVLAAVVVGLQQAGNEVGWGFQLQEPRFVILMAAVIFAFGLSLFGIFEVNLSGGASQTLGELQTREGPAGAFMNGMLATLLATPCTAPFLAPALGFAFSQPPAVIFASFAMIAAGLSAPYVLLSAQPGWLKFVPKAGPWMDTFKQSMGLLLMATVVWLLYVLGQQAGADAIVWTLAFLIGVGVACALVGRGFDFSASRGKKFRYGLAAAVVVGAAYLCFPERYLAAQFGGPEGGAAPAGAHVSAGGLEWQPFSVARVEELVKEGKTVFVDFTADWCTTCKANERLVLQTPEVEAAFAKHGVAPLIADYTRRSAEITRILKSFNRAGVPMYLIFPAGRAGEPIVLPTLLTKQMVIEALEKAAPRS